MEFTALVLNGTETPTGIDYEYLGVDFSHAGVAGLHCSLDMRLVEFRFARWTPNKFDCALAPGYSASLMQIESGMQTDIWVGHGVAVSDA